MIYSEKYSLQSTIIFLIMVMSYSFSESYAQGSQNYENQFFILDYENIEQDLNSFREKFFTTFPHNDPTGGTVNYDRTRRVNENILEVEKGNGLYAFIKARNDELGYDSFRLTSKPYFNLTDSTVKILFVFKGEFLSEKGLWPAWWLNGSYQSEWTYSDSVFAISDGQLDYYSGKGEFHNTPSSVNCTDWPSGGEIDIIENINGENLIHNTIHTCPQMCNSEWNDDGIIINCANSNPEDPNPGCSGREYEIETTSGTFACLWEEGSIKFYYWKPNVDVRMPGGPLSSIPQPTSWDEDYLKNKVRLLESHVECSEEVNQEWQCENCKDANNCSFINMKMIFNATICGVWAGNKFDSTNRSFENCNNYVLGDGKTHINNKYMKIEYVAVRNL